MSRNFYKSREEIIKIREYGFRKLLKYAYNNSKFYRDYYSSHGIRKKDLDEIPISELPPIDKKIFIENFDQLTTREELNRKDIEKFLKKSCYQDEKYLNQYTVVHSSGSTGQPTYFIYDKPAWETVLAAGFRACKGEFEIKDIMKIGVLDGIRVAYIAATEGRFGGVMAANAGIKGFGFEPLLVNINMPLNKWVDKIQDFQPNVIIGYPSGVQILCDLISEGKIHVNVIRVITGGEPLTKPLRNYIESVLKSEVFDIYGASESIILGLGRRDYHGLYLFDDINYMELDKDCTYLTPLYNFAQPLIRYRLSDKLKGKKRNKNEILPYTKIEKIVGRNEEIMWFKNEDGKEDFIHPLIVDEIEVKGLEKYQFVQLSSHEFKIRVVLQKSVNKELLEKEIRKQMDDILKEKNLTNLNYWIEEVQEIPINPATGKSKMVIKEMES